MNPFVFEELLLLCFEEQGFKVKRNTRHTGDGGIDGTVFNRQGQKILIQAKRYSSSINPQHMEEFNKTISREKAYGGFFIHTGRTRELSRVFKTERIKIISGEKLINLTLGTHC